MAKFTFNPLKSLQYYAGINFSGMPNVFPKDNINTNYVLTEQSFDVSVYGLKPWTMHDVFIEDNINVTSYVKQTGPQYRRDKGMRLFVDDQGRVDFTFYFNSDIVPTTIIEKSASLAQLLSGTKRLSIRSADGTSSANITLTPPGYVKEEPEITYKKTPITSKDESISTELTILQSPKTSIQSGLTYFTPGDYSYVQTFYADPEIVNNSGEILISSIDLYFKQKPNALVNTSGTSAPAVSIAICDVENDVPIISKCYAQSLTEKQFKEIYSYSDASTPTTFGLKSPLKLQTGRFYGIVVIFGDSEYKLWTNITGDKLVGTNTPSPGTNTVKDGKLFARNNSGVFTARLSEDLKFSINTAKFIASTATKVFVNKNYEFLTIDNPTGSFVGGEWVYKDVSPSAGTLSVVKDSDYVVGTSTSFNSLYPGQPIVIYSNTTYSQIFTVKSIANNTIMSISERSPFTNPAASYKITTVGRVYYKDEIENKIYLVDSTANNVYLQPNDVIIGEDSRASANIVSVDNLSTDRLKLKGGVRVPPASSIKFDIATAALQSGNYVYSDNNIDSIQVNDVKCKNITKYDGYVLSRSNEILNNNLYSNTGLVIANKSVKVVTEMNIPEADKSFSPSIEDNRLDLYSIQNKVSNTYTTVANGIIIDTEVAGNGLALSRHIGTKVQFNNNRFAEDVRVFMTAYRPLGTELRVYARLHNSEDPEAFDDKAWTPLRYIANENKYSSSSDENDFVEYELGLMPYSDSANSVPGTFTASYLNKHIVAQGVNPSSYVQAGDVVKLYSSLFPDTNYFVTSVNSANSTMIVLNSPVSSNNVVGSGYRVSTLKYKNIAFNNVNNTNIARYLNGSLAEFDRFDSMQIKIVMLADTTYLVPKVDQIQVIGVSA